MRRLNALSYGLMNKQEIYGNSQAQKKIMSFMQQHTTHPLVQPIIKIYENLALEKKAPKANFNDLRITKIKDDDEIETLAIVTVEDKYNTYELKIPLKNLSLFTHRQIALDASSQEKKFLPPTPPPPLNKTPSQEYLDKMEHVINVLSQQYIKIKTPLEREVFIRTYLELKNPEDQKAVLACQTNACLLRMIASLKNNQSLTDCAYIIDKLQELVTARRATMLNVLLIETDMGKFKIAVHGTIYLKQKFSPINTQKGEFAFQTVNAEELKQFKEEFNLTNMQPKHIEHFKVCVNENKYVFDVSGTDDNRYTIYAKYAESTELSVSAEGMLKEAALDRMVSIKIRTELQDGKTLKERFKQNFEEQQVEQKQESKQEEKESKEEISFRPR